MDERLPSCDELLCRLAELKKSVMSARFQPVTTDIIAASFEKNRTVANANVLDASRGLPD